MGGPQSPPTHVPSSSRNVVTSPPSTLALLSLAQDIAALVSLSLEATASLVHDWVHSSLLTIGVGHGQVVRYAPPPAKGPKASMGRGEAGRGLAVVFVGVAESTGQSLTFHLAKSGYTVFALLPLPSPHSPPTSHALSSLLLTWSAAQKRLRSRYPRHPGSIIPIMVDPESKTQTWSQEMKGKGRARFGHASETVRAYVAENRLRLVAVICASREDIRTEMYEEYEGEADARSDDDGEGMDRDLRPDSPDTEMIEEHQGGETSHFGFGGMMSTSGGLGISLQPYQPAISPSVISRIPHPATRMFTTPSGLLAADESALLSLYRSNVLEPLAVIREFQDLLAVPARPDGRRGRVIFVNSSARLGQDEQHVAGREAALGVIQAARGETARVLREEMSEIGVEVCEVAVGPMTPRLAPNAPGARHLRHISEDSAGSGNDASRRRLMESVLVAQNRGSGQAVGRIPAPDPALSRSTILASRLALLSQLWEVDDALLYSSVRRAIEDRYPRAKHHAGLSPFVESLAGAVPGMGMMKAVGRWVLGRLLVPRGG